MLPLEINVYGTREDAEAAGSILSRSGIFLQRPLNGLDGVDYHNPHLLQVEAHPEVLTPPPLPVTQDSIVTPGLHVETSAQVNESIDSILDSLTHHVDTQEIPVDGRIKTKLLDHQKEAIDFVFQREKGQVPSQLSLWKYNDRDMDEPFYQHVFSGAKRRQPDEVNGGIIADEMGLGKSLVILSTIAGSLDRAKEFVASENQLLSTGPSRTYPSRATLIIAPSSLLINNWIEEVYKHTYPGALRFHKHLGVERHAEAARLSEKDIVFTTYATVAAEVSRGKSAVAHIKWFRIVLDEAHDIRNPSTNQFKAITSLSAQHRWCLTGTPIQNSLEDLGSLVSFLKVPILEKPPLFRKFITNPTTSDSKACFQNLRALLQAICLRRTKEILNFPEPPTIFRTLPFTPLEQAAYDDLLSTCKTKINMIVSNRRHGFINSTMLESLFKLRLFCNNGNTSLVPHPEWNDLREHSSEALAYLGYHDQNICDNSNFPVFPPTTGPNTHPFAAGGNGVPYYSSKLLALLSDIRAGTEHKSIVFSGWKTTLTLAGELLRHHGIRLDMIEGSLPLTERIKVLNNFRDVNGPNVLLMTLGTGAVGLNLAIASRIYLLEPQWNPSIESQAIGRALRLGRTTPVVVFRYIMAGTVEEVSIPNYYVG
ncbi:hypothetical protein HFD88_002582 [Aspergillus terreus]|nr:hypothetical protein HFD88_002582 [Aspergillus terreus]